MLDYINDIRKALDNDCWYSALALALTLPDICGEIEFKQFHSVGKRYREWYLKYIQKKGYYTAPNNKDILFTSEECYQLRCSFLHSHLYDIENSYLKESIKQYDTKDAYFSMQIVFELYASKDETICKRSFSNDYSTRIQTRKIRLNIYYLCYALCNEAETFYKNNKEAFIKRSLNIIEIIS